MTRARLNIPHARPAQAQRDADLTTSPPGPEPQFFFAPDRVVKRSDDWGQAGLETRVADAWHPFCDWISGWLETIHGDREFAAHGSKDMPVWGNVFSSMSRDQAQSQLRFANLTKYIESIQAK